MALNLVKNDLLSAQKARELTGIKKVTLDEVMNDIRFQSERKKYELTYNLLDKTFEDGVVEALIELGYNVQLKKFSDDSAYLDIN